VTETEWEIGLDDVEFGDMNGLFTYINPHIKTRLYKPNKENVSTNFYAQQSR
jgi:hypothetical protein